MKDQESHKKVSCHLNYDKYYLSILTETTNFVFNNPQIYH